MANLNLPQNFRTVSRIDTQWFSRLTFVAAVMIIFFTSLFTSGSIGFLGLGGQRVLGSKAGPGVDLKDLLNQAAADIEEQKIVLAREKLSIVLTFDPNNVYAMGMARRIQVELDELQAEISKTLSVVDKQPNWKEAWLKLGDLYEKAGSMELASDAREKARGLKTS